MARLEARFPGAAEVFQLRFDAFDVEMDQRAVGKDQFDRAGRRVAFLEADGEQRKHLVGVAAPDTGTAHIQHPGKGQNRLAALEGLAGARFLPPHPRRTG
jgi:uncharacterized protein (DUF58 family)